MSNVHAKLSPSGAHRWLNCTASAALEDKFPNVTSKYAEEGTLAHSIVEEKLQRIIKGKPRGTASARLKKKEYYKPELEGYTDDYVTLVCEVFDELKKQDKHPVLSSEMKVSFENWVEGGFGTTDTAIIADGTMYIFDFKYGQGVRVEAHENPQLMLYALGAYYEFEPLYDIDHVVMYIVQPRVVDGVTSFEMDIKDLLYWADNLVKPKAEMAAAGEGPCVEGDWCKFCRAKTVCKARAIKYLEFLKETEKNPKLLSEKDLATILPLAEYIKGWAKELKDYMMDQAINLDVHYPGYKLVESRADRVILNPKALADRLLKAGYEDIYELKGITSLESICGKKAFTEIAGGLVEKPAGKATLVPESDPRPALGEDKDMFNDGFEEEIK